MSLQQFLQKLAQTSFETNRKVNQQLTLFQQKSISRETCESQILEILEPFPELVEEFSSISRESFVMSSAVQFVNKVKIHYNQQPEKYSQFLLILKNPKDADTFTKIQELFQDSEELIQEFQQFYPPVESHVTVDEETPLIESLPKQSKSKMYIFIAIGLVLSLIAIVIGLYMVL